jgi:GR25 family glycosyltransferase involved in LPS biosynthesis
MPKQRCVTFSQEADFPQAGIGPIFVLNLDRQANRWADMVRELDRIVDATGRRLSERAVRFSACDAQSNLPDFLGSAEVDPYYTLRDQLFVEPQPQALPDEFDLERPIRMTLAEVAIAHSHIRIWKAIAQSEAPYALVLEDDVVFKRNFGRILDQAWREMSTGSQSRSRFDILYVSYKEVRHGAPKTLTSEHVFCPERGLWYLSGYVLSKVGAKALLNQLPCQGPIDLWINYKFRELKVRALRRSMVNQRRDLHSTNTYSILPALSQIGVLHNDDAALFRGKPPVHPVFAFGAQGAGLSSLAMAISMLGYRCCSDYDSIPDCELHGLLSGSRDRVFDAYVNIDSLVAEIPSFSKRFPKAKYIVIYDKARPIGGRAAAMLDSLTGLDTLHLNRGDTGGWRALCEHLRLAPPDAPYPTVDDVGLRGYQGAQPEKASTLVSQLRHDRSPWIAKPRTGWDGIRASALEEQNSSASIRAYFEDSFAEVQSARWLLRNDTFPGNLGLFRRANVIGAASGGLSLAVIEEPLGVRNLSAAAISSRSRFLFGRFEATLRATSVPGLVTGFFLHRNSPRQEIDIEILGNRPDHLLVNVFYNPGTEGARFDYGYRGTPAIIRLGFDASKGFHIFTIDWDPCEIRWFVDRKLVYRRATWDPTPIPHLPMTLHVNTWPTQSRELAGRLARRALPASSLVRRVTVDAYNADAEAQPHSRPQVPLVYKGCPSA